MKQWMNCHSVLSRVRNVTCSSKVGSSQLINADFKLYEGKSKLGIHDGYILWGSQVIVPHLIEPKYYKSYKRGIQE